MTIWFTADLHFNHVGVIKYCNRPWSTVEDMNEGLIHKWNSVVKQQDTVYVVGDFAFRGKANIEDILSRLKGKKHLIEGNHDRQNRLKANEKALFESISQYIEITIQDSDAIKGRRRITLCHYAMMTWRERNIGSFMLHGHSHGNFKNEVFCPLCGENVIGDCYRLDVGVDCHNYFPVSYEKVKKIMSSKNPVLV